MKIKKRFSLIDAFDDEMWLMLREIKKLYLKTPQGEPISFALLDHPNTVYTNATAIPSFNNQRFLLRYLQNEKMVRLNILEGNDFDSAKSFSLLLRDIFWKYFEDFEKAAKRNGRKVSWRPIEFLSYENGMVILASNAKREEIDLTARSVQDKCFQMLWEQRGKTTGYDELTRVARVDQAGMKNAISHLREKLGDARPTGIIQTFRGQGYTLKQNNFK